MPQLSLITVTCPDADCARSIARAAIEARLAACASLPAPVESLFHWHGQVETEQEVELHLKTAQDRVEALQALIREQHPYDLPVILHLTAEVDEETAQWALEATRQRN
jgi:periplasmic divalent cation tolerance protein